MQNFIRKIVGLLVVLFSISLTLLYFYIIIVRFNPPQLGGNIETFPSYPKPGEIFTIQSDYLSNSEFIPEKLIIKKKNSIPWCDSISFSEGYEGYVAKGIEKYPVNPLTGERVGPNRPVYISGKVAELKIKINANSFLYDKVVTLLKVNNQDTTKLKIQLYPVSNNYEAFFAMVSRVDPFIFIFFSIPIAIYGFFVIIGLISFGWRFICYQSKKEALKYTWMNKNLDTEYYRNGDPITQVQDKNEWLQLKTGAWCYYQDDLYDFYGNEKLYNYYAVIDKRGLAPEGWHIPTKKEFKALQMAFDFNGNALKEIGEGEGKGIGTNTSGFSAKYTSGRRSNGEFLSHGAIFWSSTSISKSKAFVFGIYEHLNETYFERINKNYGFAVRCVKNIIKN